MRMGKTWVKMVFIIAGADVAGFWWNVLMLLFAFEEGVVMREVVIITQNSLVVSFLTVLKLCNICLHAFYSSCYLPYISFRLNLQLLQLSLYCVLSKLEHKSKVQNCLQFSWTEEGWNLFWTISECNCVSHFPLFLSLFFYTSVTYHAKQFFFLAFSPKRTNCQRPDTHSAKFHFVASVVLVKTGLAVWLFCDL